MLSIGALLISIALLTLAALVPLFTSSSPPRWTTRGWIEELVTLSIAAALAFGVADLGAGAVEAFRAGPDYLDLGLLVLILFASIVVWRRLKARPPQQVEPRARPDLPASGLARSSSTKSPATADGPSPPQKAA